MSIDGAAGEKFYIRDAVYGFWTAWGQLTLTTEDGRTVSNVIHLEPDTIAALLDVIEARKGYCARQEVAARDPDGEGEPVPGYTQDGEGDGVAP